MKTFQELRDEHNEEMYAPMCEELVRYLEEKLLILGKGGNYGNAVILAGGAGSGKSFAVKNLMQGEKFKVLNPDDIKDALLAMRDALLAPPDKEQPKLKGIGAFLQQHAPNISSPDTKTQPRPPKSYKLLEIINKIGGLDYRDPRDTSTLHMLIQKMKLNYQRIMRLFTAKHSELPNIMFDITAKKIEDINGKVGGDEGALYWLEKAGYKPENIHIVWVLTNYKIALEQNLTRERVVPTDILLGTHTGAAATMEDIMFRSYGTLGINGDIAVILGGQTPTTVVAKAGSKYKYTQGPNRGKTIEIKNDTTDTVVLDFKYFRVKKAGSREINGEALSAIRNYVLEKVPPPHLTPNQIQAYARRRIGTAHKHDPSRKTIHPVTSQALDAMNPNPKKKPPR